MCLLILESDTVTANIKVKACRGHLLFLYRV